MGVRNPLILIAMEITGPDTDLIPNRQYRSELI